MIVLRRLRRAAALADLDRIDAEVARHYVNDGQLSERPLGALLSPSGLDLRARRLRAVERLERAGGRDPWPSVLREPMSAQRAGWRAGR